jgi:hypothetical protein
MGRNWHRVFGNYTADPDRPLVTVMLIAPDKGDPGTPQVMYNGASVQVALPSGRALRFIRANGDWSLARP